MGVQICPGSGSCWPNSPKPLPHLANPLPKPNSQPNQPANPIGWLLRGLLGEATPPNRGLRWLKKLSPHQKAPPSRDQEQPPQHKPRLFLAVNRLLSKPAHLHPNKHLPLGLFQKERPPLNTGLQQNRPQNPNSNGSRLWFPPHQIWKCSSREVL